MMSWMIGHGVAADLDELELLYNELNDYLSEHTNYPGWIKGIYPVRETAADGVEEGTIYVARDDGRIAGTVILRRAQEPAYAEVDWQVNLTEQEILTVHTLAVHPRCLGSGVGKRLMQFAIERARTTGAKALRLDVYEKNTPAIRLYQRYGFQPMGTADLGYGKYGLDNFILFQKML